MNQRIDIKIAIVGQEGSGKETFSKMLFLDNTPKNVTNHSSTLSEVIMEIDMEHFKNTSKKIIDKCKSHNNLIAQRTEIKNIQTFRENNIEPLIYAHTKRIRDLINYTAQTTHMNKNILLTFYIIGNNYLEFQTEIESANILIHIVDINKPFTNDNLLYKYLVNIINKSNHKKYLLTLINKCDTLNQNGEFVLQSNEHNIVNGIDQIIRKNANELDIVQNMLHPIVMTCKYASIYRQIMHLGISDINPNDKLLIANMFSVKKDSVVRDIQKNSNKYLQQSGYIAFRDVLSHILNTKYKSMIDDNYNNEVKKMDNFLSNPLDNSKIILPEKICILNVVHDKASRLEKIFKTTYQEGVKYFISKFLNNIIDTESKTVIQEPLNNSIQQEETELAIIEVIQEIYNDNNEFKQLIEKVSTQIQNKIVKNIVGKLYEDILTENTLLPSKVHEIFDKLCESHTSKEEIKKLSTYICELYSTKIRNGMESINPNLLFKTYFSSAESMKLLSMLNELTSMINFDKYKMYLIQILLTKLMVVEKCIEHKDQMEKNDINKLITYCRSLKHYLSDNIYKKYDFFFGNISDICTNLLLKLDATSQLIYVSENIDFVLDFKPDRVINLDKFIIKTIKKTTYKSLVADDEEDSNDDSDVDIYGEDDVDFIPMFESTKVESDNETLPSKNDKRKSKKKTERPVISV